METTVIRKSTKTKYLEALRDLQQSSDGRERRIRTRVFAKKRGLSATFIRACAEKGLIEYRAGAGRKPGVYKWVSPVPPNIKTAEGIIDHVNYTINGGREMRKIKYEQKSLDKKVDSTTEKDDVEKLTPGSLTIDKYFEVIKSLYTVLQYTNAISMREFCSKNGISNTAATEMQNCGIIRKGENNGRAAFWYWNTTEPTKQMAKEVLERVNEASRLAMEKTNAKKKAETKSVETTPLVSHYEVSFLGIKFKIKPIFK